MGAPPTAVGTCEPQAREPLALTTGRDKHDSHKKHHRVQRFPGHRPFQPDCLQSRAVTMARPHIPGPVNKEGFFPSAAAPGVARDNVTAYVTPSKRPFQLTALRLAALHIPCLPGRLLGQVGPGAGCACNTFLPGCRGGARWAPRRSGRQVRS